MLDEQKTGQMAECLSHEGLSRTAHFHSGIEREEAMWAVLLQCPDKERKQQYCDISLSVFCGPSERAERFSSPPCAEKTRQVNFWWSTQMHVNNLDSLGSIQEMKDDQSHS